MRTKILTFLAFFVFIAPTLVLAHAGHGTFDGVSFWHYLTSPLHVISAMVVLAVVVLAVRFFRKRQIN